MQKSRSSVIRRRLCFDGTYQTIIRLPGLSEPQQLEFIKVIDTSHLPQNDIHTLEGDRFFLLPNTDAWPDWQKADAILPYK
jgi:hypothetical protein